MTVATGPTTITYNAVTIIIGPKMIIVWMGYVWEHLTAVFHVKHTMVVAVQSSLDTAFWSMVAKEHALLRININLEILARWALTSGITKNSSHCDCPAVNWACWSWECNCLLCFWVNGNMYFVCPCKMWTKFCRSGRARLFRQISPCLETQGLIIRTEA